MRKALVSARWRVASILFSVTALVLAAMPVVAQTGSTIINVDTPTSGASIRNGQETLIGGWAVDTAGPGVGVDGVQVYLDGEAGSGGTFVGSADYGKGRDDVASALGSSAFTNSGFDYKWTPMGVSSGPHTLNIRARSMTSSWVYKVVNITIQPPATPAPPTPGRTGTGGYGPDRSQGLPWIGGTYGQGCGGGYGIYGGSGGYGGGYGGGGYGGGYGGGGYGGGYGGGGYGGGCGGGGGYGAPFGGGAFPYGGYGYGAPFGNYGAPGSYTQTVNVVAPAGGSVFLTWIAAPYVQNYRIYQTTISSPNNFTVVQTVPQSAGILATNATITGLSAGTNYLFQVRGVDQNGLETVIPASAGFGLGVAVPVLQPPTGLTVSSTTASTASLTWGASPGGTTYRVFQATGGGQFVPSVISSATTTSAIVGGLLPLTTYQFQVIAVDAFGAQSGPSNTASGTTTA